MRILAIDSSGLPASAAVTEDGKVTADFTINCGMTHSQTLLPMIDAIFRMAGIDKESLDAVTVAKGPGSFTGLRIGSATAKGIGLALELPVIEVSTLEALAYQMYGFDGEICPMMDARRDQVYTGIYRFRGESLACVYEDRAEAVSELIGHINAACERVIFLGDGVPVYKEMLKDIRVPYIFAKPFQSFQRAAALGILAEEYYKKGLFVNADDHAPVYLRMSQAERERKARLEGKS